MPAKPFSEASEQNKAPILAVLTEVFASRWRVLEIGSGTGQHAVYFAAHLPHLTWIPSDLPDNHPGIKAWLDEAALSNIDPIVALDVRQNDWGELCADAVFSANSAHIMDWDSVQAMFAGVGALLPEGGVFALYGPFSYGGQHTSPSNARFDAWLKQMDPTQGVRDFEDLNRLAVRAGMGLQQDTPMPVNNRTLVWVKCGTPPSGLP